MHILNCLMFKRATIQRALPVLYRNRLPAGVVSDITKSPWILPVQIRDEKCIPGIYREYVDAHDKTIPFGWDKKPVPIGALFVADTSCDFLRKCKARGTSTILVITDDNRAAIRGNSEAYNHYIATDVFDINRILMKITGYTG